MLPLSLNALGELCLECPVSALVGALAILTRGENVALVVDCGIRARVACRALDKLLK